MPPKSKSLSVPESLRSRYEEIVTFTDALCKEHLNEEYAQVCRAMTATLSRKRPSPLLGGNAKSWACAIAHMVRMVNFLFDKSQTPHLRTDALCDWFGLSKSTGANKSTQIKQILKIGVFDPQWTLPSRMDRNPMAWTVSVNGFIVDTRSLPRHLAPDVRVGRRVRVASCVALGEARPRRRDGSAGPHGG
jgi:hypothetical protein